MECAAVQKRLTAYIDRELDEQARDVVKTHLNLCSACSVEYDRLKKTLSAAKAWPARPLPADFVESVRERAGAGEQGPSLKAPGFSLRDLLWSLPRPAWQAAAACAILLVGLLVGHLVWPRTVAQERVVAGHNGVHDKALETLATLQHLKIVQKMRGGDQRTIVELSEMQRELAIAIGPDVANKVMLYHQAEALIADGRIDDADAILYDLERDPQFALAPYARITRLAAQPVPGADRVFTELLVPELLASPERLYERIRTGGGGFARSYTEALDASLNWLGPIRLPEALYREPTGAD